MMKNWVLLSLFISGSAHAFQLTIQDRTYLNPALTATLDSMANAMETQFNTTIASVSNQSSFLGAIGNANAASSRSYLSPGVVPANRDFFVSLGGSGAFALGSGATISGGLQFPQNQLPPIGVGAKTGLTVGVTGRYFPSFLPLDPSKLMFSVSYFNMDLSRIIGHGVGLKSSQFGAGISYQAYEPQSWSPLIRFNGFKISSGLTYSSFDASFSTPFNLSQTSGPIDMSWNSSVDLGVSSHVFTLSNEVTTGIRLLWLLNLYTGVGLDFNFGSSKVTGSSNGPVSASSTGTPVFTGNAVISSDDSGTAPTFLQLRYLVGTEIDLGPFGVYVQGQVSTPSVYGVNVGAHFLF